MPTPPGSKYEQFDDEILQLWHNNFGIQRKEIAESLIEKYGLDKGLQNGFRQYVGRLIETAGDREIVSENVRLAKQKQKAADQNRIANKSFREYARVENALEELNKELIAILKKEGLKFKTVKHKSGKEETALIVHITDTHFNELVNIETNQYDFYIAGKRLQKFAHKIKKQAELYNVKSIFIAITGDLMNSDRRLDEKLAMSTNRSKATFLGVKLLQQFIVDLNSVANVSVACVTGNESRVAQDVGFIDITASDNYDFTIFEMLRMLFSNHKGVEFISGDPLELVVNVAGKNVLLIHGHQLTADMQRSVQNIVGKYANRGIIIDFVMSGHIHSCYISDMFARSGSLVGDNAYSHRALHYTSKASQNLYIYHADGSRDDMRIDLQKTDGYKGYEIGDDIDAYNAKSESKVKGERTIFKIVI